ncbi:MAG: MATE family efflux transporter [Lachnospiraceae bacterium]|nr:MATE family efflux transporter [Lachnospiraceae bacterium]
MITMTKDLTNGSPTRLILGFSLPLLCGYLFQQFYSMADTMIVGRFLGVNSLAAVGSTGSVNFLIIGFCMGLCSGFSIPIAQQFGAGNEKAVRKYIANSAWLIAVISVAMAAVTCLLSRNILTLMQTPDNILEEANTYIWIIFLGIPATCLYNILSGIMRALGDSKTPVIFLLISSFLNIGLDIFCILVLNMGVAGAAWATVISQAVSGIACLIYMLKKFELMRISREEWRPDFHQMGILCGMGIPMGLQYSITAIGSGILQSATNSLGSDAVASITAGSKVSMFLCCPFDAMGATMATYSGQNIGAGKLDRVGEGMRACVLLGAAYSVFAFTFTFFFGRDLAGLFVDGAEASILNQAALYLKLNTAFYFPLALVNIVRFTIQGMGFPRFAILAGVFEMAARSITAFALVPVLGFTGSCLGNPVAWIFADLFLIPAYFHVRKTMARILKLKQENGMQRTTDKIAAVQHS